MKSVMGIGLSLTFLVLIITVNLVYSAPTYENATAILKLNSEKNVNATALPSNSATDDSSNTTSILHRVGKFLGISLGLGLYGDPYPFGQPYPCTVYGYPAPYAPPGSFPCGYPSYFG